MRCRDHQPPTDLLFGYDPQRDLPNDHLARLVEAVVEDTFAKKPQTLSDGPGQPMYDPRLLCKVLIYGYTTGVRSSRQLQRLCYESLPYLFLARDDRPSYRTLCSFRIEHPELIEEVFVGLFAVATEAGVKRLGRIVVDSSKIRADTSPEAVVKNEEFEDVLTELKRILAEAAAADAKEDEEPPGTTLLGKQVPDDQMRDILRRVRKQRRKKPEAPTSEHQAQSQDGPVGETAPTPGEEKPSPQAQITTEPPPATPQAATTTQKPPASSDAELELVAQEPGAKPGPSPDSSKRPGPNMFEVIRFSITALEKAIESGLKHLSMTDPDARMMGEGRSKRIQECYSFEAAVDNGLLVVGQTTQDGNDNARLETLVEVARANEPDGVFAVDADSGYYRGDAIRRLIEAGIDLCVPDSNTACDMRRNEPAGSNRGRQAGKVALTYDAEADRFICPEGKQIVFRQFRDRRDLPTKVYVAEHECTGCPLAKECLTQKTAKRKTVTVIVDGEILAAARKRFDEPEMRERYHHRADQIETVFGFIRGSLGFTRWMVRGADRVAAEATLIKAAYQFRKIQSRLRLIGQPT